MGFGSTGHGLTVSVTSLGDLIPMREILGFPALQQAFLFGFVQTRMGCCRAPGTPSYHRMYPLSRLVVQELQLNSSCGADLGHVFPVRTAILEYDTFQLRQSLSFLLYQSIRHRQHILLG